MKLSNFLCCVFIPLMLLTGCPYNVTTYDPNAIDETVRSIQHKIDKEDYVSLYMESSDKLKKEITQEQVIATLSFFHKRLGKRLSSSPSGNIVENIDGETYISSFYNSDFENGSGVEKFIFLKTNDGIYALAGHHYDVKFNQDSEKFIDEKTTELLKIKVKSIISMIDEQDYSSVYKITTREVQEKYSEEQFSAGLADLHADIGRHIESDYQTITLNFGDEQYFVILAYDFIFEKAKGSGEFSFLYDHDNNTYTFSGYQYKFYDKNGVSVSRP